MNPAATAAETAQVTSAMLEGGAIMLGAALLFVTIFRRLKLGATLGYIVAGILIGPQLLGLIHDPEQLASVRDELILPALNWIPFCFMGSSENLRQLFLLMPFVARARAEDFYFAKADLDTLRRPWDPEDSLQLLRSYRDRYYGGTAKPARAAPTPGRNDPCPCGSGRKYKRCCAAPSADAQLPR